MQWKVSDAKGSGTDYICEAGNAPLADAIAELWRKYLNDAAPLNAQVNWDHLRVELWLDSGRIILFPARTPFQSRVEKSSCQVICPVLLNFYETLIDADLPDETLEAEIQKKEREVTDLLIRSGRQMKLPSRLNRQSVNVRCYGADLQNAVRAETFSI